MIALGKVTKAADEKLVCQCGAVVGPLMPMRRGFEKRNDVVPIAAIPSASTRKNELIPRYGSVLQGGGGHA